MRCKYEFLSSKVFWTSDLQTLRSRVMARFVMARFANLECHCSLFRTIRSKTCPWSVATLLVLHST